MKKSEKIKSNIGLAIVFILCAALCTPLVIIYLDSVFDEYGLFLSVLFKLAVFLFAYYIQMIIHEAGHLFAGLLSGYSFGSFRIGNLMLIKENGKYSIKRQSIAGTGGQCLMTPPPMKNGKYPVVFYNIGGVLMNFLTLPICVLMLARCVGKPLPYVICVTMFLSGLLIVLTNGIPLKLGMLNNDGANAVEVARNRESRMVFHNQFMIIDEIRRGKRLRDMDEALFPMPSDEGMKKSISASGAVFFENRLMDEGKYDEALELINRLLIEKNAIIGLYKNLLVADKITILLIKGEGLDAVEKYYTSAQYQAFKKQMKTNISVIRTDYAYALLKLQDEKIAGEALALFDKCSKMHPYVSDIESEKELIALIDKSAKNTINSI